MARTRRAHWHGFVRSLLLSSHLPGICRDSGVFCVFIFSMIYDFQDSMESSVFYEGQQRRFTKNVSRAKSARNGDEFAHHRLREQSLVFFFLSERSWPIDQVWGSRHWFSRFLRRGISFCLSLWNHEKDFIWDSRLRWRKKRSGERTSRRFRTARMSSFF